MQCTGIAPAVRWAGLVIAVVLTFVPASPAAAETGQVSASERLLIASAGWHGRPIRHPHRHTVRTASAERVPSGWKLVRSAWARARTVRRARGVSAGSRRGSGAWGTGQARSTASSASAPSSRCVVPGQARVPRRRARDARRRPPPPAPARGPPQGTLRPNRSHRPGRPAASSSRRRRPSQRPARTGPRHGGSPRSSCSRSRSGSRASRCCSATVVSRRRSCRRPRRPARSATRAWSRRSA